MVFSTIIFLCVYLPLTIILYYIMPQKCKNYFLLFASLVFYAWGEPRFVFVMLASILCNYIVGLLLAGGISRGGISQSDISQSDISQSGIRQEGICQDGIRQGSRDRGGRIQGRRRAVLMAAVILNLGILFVFKYLTFGMENLHRLIPSVPVWQIALPIGISFYTFQGMSYVIDVYREAELVQKNPFKLALYISMFPQLIAGPIVRYCDIRDSLDRRTHTVERFAQGAGRFIIGLSKKAILANMMGQLADSILTGDYQVMGALVAWLGAIAYTLQIYFDFSGYSDMAIGLGKLFGFDFRENFNYPYISTSIREFWRRWHMSLSGWFRDYLYIPLGGSRYGNVYLHLLIVFMATGIWHGAAWGFLLWGLWHGFFSIMERFLAARRRESGHKAADVMQKTDDTRRRTLDAKSRTTSGRGICVIRLLLGWIYTMLVVIIGWVLFAIVNVRDFVSYLGVMFGTNTGRFHAYGIRYYLSNQMLFYLAAAVLACIPWSAVLERLAPRVYDRWFVRPTLFADILHKLILLALLALCFIFIINSSYNPFIYFRF